MKQALPQPWESEPETITMSHEARRVVRNATWHKVIQFSTRLVDVGQLLHNAWSTLTLGKECYTISLMATFHHSTVIGEIRFTQYVDYWLQCLRMTILADLVHNYQSCPFVTWQFSFYMKAKTYTNTSRVPVEWTAHHHCTSSYIFLK